MVSNTPHITSLHGYPAPGLHGYQLGAMLRTYWGARPWWSLRGPVTGSPSTDCVTLLDNFTPRRRKQGNLILLSPAWSYPILWTWQVVAWPCLVNTPAGSGGLVCGEGALLPLHWEGNLSKEPAIPPGHAINRVLDNYCRVNNNKNTQQEWYLFNNF